MFTKVLIFILKHVEDILVFSSYIKHCESYLTESFGYVEIMVSLSEIIYATTT